MKNFKGVIIGVFFLGVLAFSFYQNISLIKERNGLLSSLNQAENQAARLQNEKQNLLQDLEKKESARQELSGYNTALKEYLRAGIERLNRLFAKAEQLEAGNSILKAENSALRADKEQAEGKLSQLARENESFRQRFYSLAELRKAIRELKKNQQEYRRIRQFGPGAGNRGFIIKDGKIVSPPEARIEVLPAPAH